MRTALACLLVCAAFAAQAQSGVYKWKDKNGTTHYSDAPPPAGQYGDVQPNASARVKPPAQPDPRCTTARTNVERLKSGNTDIGLDANGDGKPDAVMTAEQRAAQLRLAEAAQANYCKSATP